jgi:hypothetical protein
MYSSNGDTRRNEYERVPMYPADWSLMSPISQIQNHGYPGPGFGPLGLVTNFGFPYPIGFGQSMSVPSSPIYQTNTSSNFNPRYIEDLRTERTYLLNTLRIENERANELLSRVPQLKCGVVDNSVPQMRRRMRKQLGWVRHRLNETYQQEQAIMARLGQLMEEIRCVEERNMHMERESYHFQQLHGNAMQSIQMLHLDPTSPVFQPDGFQFFLPDGNNPYNSHNLEGRPIERHTMIATPDHNRNETKSFQDSNMLLKIEKDLMVYGIAGGSDKSSKRPGISQRSSSMSIEGSLFDREEEKDEMQEQRRHSLPCLPGVSQIWSLSNSENIKVVVEKGTDCRSHNSGATTQYPI